ncbi:CDP-glycerol:poly(glycerophosphate) glycerophosphotransferase [compost metagenome]
MEDLPFDLYKCLSIASGIITDYSSIAFDFAATGKPIYFYTPDLDDYTQNDRETYFNLTDFVENIASSPEELKNEIHESIMHIDSKIYRYFEIETRPNGEISKEFQIKVELLLNEQHPTQ